MFVDENDCVKKESKISDVAERGDSYWCDFLE